MIAMLSVCGCVGVRAGFCMLWVRVWGFVCVCVCMSDTVNQTRVDSAA